MKPKKYFGGFKFKKPLKLSGFDRENSRRISGCENLFSLNREGLFRKGIFPNGEDSTDFVENVFDSIEKIKNHSKVKNMKGMNFKEENMPGCALIMHMEFIDNKLDEANFHENKINAERKKNIIKMNIIGRSKIHGEGFVGGRDKGK